MVSNPICFPAYEQYVKVVIGNTLKDACLENNLPWEENQDEIMDAYCQRIKDCTYIVLRKDNTRKIVLHECVHAINQLYVNMNAAMDVDNDEIYVRDVSFLQDTVLSIFEECSKNSPYY